MDNFEKGRKKNQPMLGGMSDLNHSQFQPIIDSKYLDEAKKGLFEGLRLRREGEKRGDKNLMMKSNVMMQLQLDFKMHLHNFIAAKRLEFEVFSNLYADSIHKTGKLPRVLDDTSNAIKYERIMESIINKMRDMINGKSVDLEVPILSWVDLDPIMSKMKNSQIEGIYLKKDFINNLMHQIMLSNTNFPFRWHKHIKNLHSDNPRKILDNCSINGFPLNEAIIELRGLGLWLHIRTNNQFTLSRRYDRNLLNFSNPTIVLIDKFAITGMPAEIIEMEQQIDPTLIKIAKFVKDPQNYDGRIHIDSDFIDHCINSKK